GLCPSALASASGLVCPRCAASVGPFTALANGCSICRDEPFSFERVLRLGAYEGLLREAVLRMKHFTGEAVAEALAELWAETASQKLHETGASLIVPVPLFWRRRWVRGYNQSESLARALAKQLRLPSGSHLLRRTRNTPSQTQQSASKRRENVRGAFTAKPGPELTGKTVLLVDDVMTTGSTANEAA